jgi:hypothetical protein
MTSKESLHSDILQFQQHQQNEQTSSPLKSLNMKETMTNGVGYPGLEQAQKHLLQPLTCRKSLTNFIT